MSEEKKVLNDEELENANGGLVAGPAHLVTQGAIAHFAEGDAYDFRITVDPVLPQSAGKGLEEVVEFLPKEAK